MTNALALAILALMATSPGRYAPHVERQALPVAQWATQRAEWVERAAKTSSVPAPIITALVYHESSFKSASRSDAGARGLLQLHPSNPFYAGWLSVCAKEPYFCDAAAVEYGALALAAYRKRCGSMLRAITAFRIGHCTKPGPRAKATMLLAQAIHWRVKNPSKAPLRAPRLP